MHATRGGRGPIASPRRARPPRARRAPGCRGSPCGPHAPPPGWRWPRRRERDCDCEHEKRRVRADRGDADRGDRRADQRRGTVEPPDRDVRRRQLSRPGNERRNERRDRGAGRRDRRGSRRRHPRRRRHAVRRARGGCRSRPSRRIGRTCPRRGPSVHPIGRTSPRPGSRSPPPEGVGRPARRSPRARHRIRRRPPSSRSTRRTPRLGTSRRRRVCAESPRAERGTNGRAHRRSGSRHLGAERTVARGARARVRTDCTRWSRSVRARNGEREERR